MNSYLRQSILMSLRQSLVKEFFKSTNGLGIEFFVRKSSTICPRILIQSSSCNHDVTPLSLSMDKTSFEFILEKVQGRIDHNKNHRFPISPKMRLAITLRFYGSSSSVSDSKLSTEEKEKLEKAKKRKQDPAKVIVITENNNINMMTLEEAGKLAKKKLLHLVEVSGQSEHLKSDKPVYKLVSTSQFYGDDWKTKKSKDDSNDGGKGKKEKEKEEKTVLLKTKTSEHDALIKAKSIKKFVEKGHVVRVLIGQSGDFSGHNPETVYKVIEEYLKGEPLRIVQKISKNSQIRFQVMPPKKSTAPSKKEEVRKNKSTEEIKHDEDDNQDSDSDSDAHKPRAKT